MRPRKYFVRLSSDEQRNLSNLISKGTAPAKAIRRANVLLAADENGAGGRKSDAEIAELFHISTQTVYILRQQCSEEGADATVKRKKRETPPVEPKITGEVEAKIIALGCSALPEGRARWTLRLLADKSVELQYIDSISHEAIRCLLKKRTQAASS